MAKYKTLFSTRSWFNLTTWMNNWEIDFYKFTYSSHTHNIITLRSLGFYRINLEMSFFSMIIHSSFSRVDLSHLGCNYPSIFSHQDEDNSIHKNPFSNDSPNSFYTVTTWTCHLARCRSCYGSCHKLERRFHSMFISRQSISQVFNIPQVYFTQFFSPVDFCNSCLCVCVFINYALVSWPLLYYCMLEWNCMDFSILYLLTSAYVCSRTAIWKSLRREWRSFHGAPVKRDLNSGQMLERWGIG